MKALIDAEIYISITGYEGYYKVNCYGEVRSIDRYVIGRNGMLRGQVMAPSIGNMGYYGVSLYRDRFGKRFNIHRLVALHFVPLKENKNEVNHIDGDKLNNNYINLEWVDRKENALHSARILGKNRGSKNSASKLTEDQVLEIKALLKDGVLTQTAIGKRFNVTNHAIHRISKGYNWSWLDGKDRNISCVL